MSIIKFKKILSCSSEDPVHRAEHLFRNNKNKKWLSSKGSVERIICIVEFINPSLISSIEIGNNGSSSIELLVSQASGDWTILLPTTTLMTPHESQLNINRTQIRTFEASEVFGKWTRLKIICEQKYNNKHQFGLNFLRLYTIKNENKDGIMENIVFVLNGFKNPLKSILRNKAISMGATYNEVLDETCTHLICAISDTPIFKQVKETGKGFIVNKQWILDCFELGQLLPVESYQLQEISKKKKEQIPSDKPNNSKRKINGNDNDPTKKKMGEIADFFHGKHFYVSYGDYNDETLLDITRIILAYDGIIERQIMSDVTYVITNRSWNQDFDQISRTNPDINFINIDWLQDCHDANQFVPIQPYLIVP